MTRKDSIPPAKLAIVGDPCVGKTAFAQMFTSDGRKFPSSYNMTCAVHVQSKRLQLHNTEDEVGLVLFDYAGTDLYKKFLFQYCDQIDLLLVIYDLISETSFASIESWLHLIRNSIQGPPPVTALFGNKSDLGGRRVIDLASAEALAERLDVTYFEGSVKEYEGVDTVMQYLGKTWYTQHSL